MDVAALKEWVDLLELMGRDTRLKRVASTRGGAYVGRCPWCGGRDRFRVQHARRRWWCRDRWQDAIAYIQRRDGVGNFAAWEYRRASWASDFARNRRVPSKWPLRLVCGTRASCRFLSTWAERGVARMRGHFLEECEATLWSAVGDGAAPRHARSRFRLLQQSAMDTAASARAPTAANAGLQRPAPVAEVEALSS